MTEAQNKKPFYKKWWGIILTILFFPITIPIIIAKYTNWSKGVKITAIIAFIFLLFSYMANEGGKIQEEREKFCNEQLTNTGAENVSMQRKYDIIGTFTKGEKNFDFSCTGVRGKFLFSVTENFSKINTQQDQDEQNNKQEEILQNEEKQDENEVLQENQPPAEEQKETENNKEKQDNESQKQEEKTEHFETLTKQEQKDEQNFSFITKLKENKNVSTENRQDYSKKIEQLRTDCLKLADKQKNFSLFFTDYNPQKNDNITLHGGVTDMKKSLKIEDSIGNFTCFYSDENGNATFERKNLSIYFYEGNFQDIEQIKTTLKEQDNRITAIVTSISDGDTIKIKAGQLFHIIRIVGLDTPELTETRYGYSECYGKEATDFLKKILPIYEDIQVIYHGGDAYNRDLAEIFYNNENIAEIMVKNGYGWVYRGGIEPSNYQKLIQLEEQAKQQKVGLWAENTCNGQRKKIEKTQPIPKTTQPVNTNNFSSHGGNPEPFQKEFDTPNCHIKGNINKKGEKIYHTPGGRYYKKTQPEACFNTEQEAINAGFRASKV